MLIQGYVTSLEAVHGVRTFGEKMPSGFTTEATIEIPEHFELNGTTSGQLYVVGSVAEELQLGQVIDIEVHLREGE